MYTLYVYVYIVYGRDITMFIILYVKIYSLYRVFVVCTHVFLLLGLPNTKLIRNINIPNEYTNSMKEFQNTFFILLITYFH